MMRQSPKPYPVPQDERNPTLCPGEPSMYPVVLKV